jgi:hypothetical protein
VSPILSVALNRYTAGVNDLGDGCGGRKRSLNSYPGVSEKSVARACSNAAGRGALRVTFSLLSSAGIAGRWCDRASPYRALDVRVHSRALGGGYPSNECRGEVCVRPDPVHRARAAEWAGCVRYLSSSNALVEWILARCVIRCVDDVNNLRRDPTHHDLEPLP